MKRDMSLVREVLLKVEALDLPLAPERSVAAGTPSLKLRAIVSSSSTNTCGC